MSSQQPAQACDFVDDPADDDDDDDAPPASTSSKFGTGKMWWWERAICEEELSCSVQQQHCVGMSVVFVWQRGQM